MRAGRIGALFVVLGLVACEPMPELEFNLPPEAGSATITPLEPSTADELTLELVEATDPDGDTLEHFTRWTRDGSVFSVPLDIVFAEDTQKGEVWAVEVWASDGEYETERWTAQVTVLNTPPVLESAELLPEAPLTDDDLQLSLSSSDLDEDEVSYEVLWSRDGEELSEWSDELSVPASVTSQGEVWVAKVWPHDDEERGEPLSVESKIDNSAPTLISVSVSSEPDVETDIRGSLYGAADADGDSLSYYLEWYINGSFVKEVELSGNAISLDEEIEKGDTIQAVGWVSDGFLESERVASDEVTVLNAPPTTPTVDLSPTEAYEATTFSCSVTGASDPDGDALSAHYDWSVDGSWLGVDDSQLDGDSFSKDQDVLCKGWVSDGSVESEAVESGTVTIDNTPPSLSSVDIDQSSATVQDTITASYSGWSDDDGDAESVTLDWYVEGAWVRRGSSLNLGSYAKTNQVQVEATPNDGSEDGTALWSSILTISNAPPSLSSAYIMPTTAYTVDDLNAHVSGYYDADGDSASTYSYEWTIGGSSVYTGGAILDSSYTVAGDVVRVEITPNDGEEDGTAATSPSLLVRNSTPVADAVLLSSEPVESCSEAELDGSGSDDDDGDTLSYGWTVTTKPSGSKADDSYFDDITDPSPTFLIDSSGNWVFTLTVSDGSATDQDTVLVSSTLRSTNTDPVADAGGDSTTSATAACVSTGYGIVCDDCDDQEIVLDASGSTDDDGDRLAYTWSATSSVASTSFDDTSAEQPVLTVGNLSTEYGTTESYVVEVQVIASDCAGGTSTDTVTLTVECTGI